MMRLVAVMLRCLLSVALLYGAWWMTKKGEELGATMMAAPFYIIPLFMIIAAIIVSAPYTVKWLASLVGDFFTDLLYPNERGGRPPLSYVLAHHYRQQGRLHEAIEQYRRIIRYYPREENAYLELLTLAMKLADVKTYRKYARRYRWRFRKDLELVFVPRPEETKKPGWIKPWNPSGDSSPEE